MYIGEEMKGANMAVNEAPALCQVEYLRLSGCQHWSYNKRRYKCLFFSRVVGSNTTEAISGPKECQKQSKYLIILERGENLAKNEKNERKK